MTDKDNNVFMAKVSEQAERYEEMAEYMKKVVESGVELSTEERNLLSVAYKNRIGQRRASWRILKSYVPKDDQPMMSNLAKQYMERVEKELSDICEEILNLLEDFLIVKELSGSEESKVESKVFFLKMKGDYCRYKAEIFPAKEGEVEDARKAYQEAVDLAERELEPTNPIRLGLFLNYSVFHFELCGDPKQACKLAKDAFDKAISDLDKLPEDSYKDSTLIMQLLRDNLTLWTTDVETDETKVEEIEDGEKTLEDE